jgi:hypothetical protein
MPIHDAQNLAQYPQNPVGSGPGVGSVYFVDGFARAESLLAELQAAGVVLSVEGDRLAFDAPAGVLTDDLFARMRADRDGLLAMLAGVPVDSVADEPEGSGGDHGGVTDSRPRVVHLKREPFDVRIDRASKWGNPFRIGPDGDRAAVIRKYRAWVVGQAELMAALPELRGKVLGCWCAPAACHGDVLADLAEALGDSAEPVAIPGPVVTTSIRCPFCDGIDLTDAPGGLRCSSCRALAWVATDEGGLARRDAAGDAMDPDLVPICRGCGRWCDVMTLAESWRCSRCDPEAEERRRRTLRVIGLVNRSPGRTVPSVR